MTRSAGRVGDTGFCYTACGLPIRTPISGGSEWAVSGTGPAFPENPRPKSARFVPLFTRSMMKADPTMTPRWLKRRARSDGSTRLPLPTEEGAADDCEGHPHVHQRHAEGPEA